MSGNDKDKRKGEEYKPLIHIGYNKTGSTFLQKHVFNEEFGFHSPFDEYFAEIIDTL